MLKILIILSYHRVIGDFSFLIDASGTIQATYYYDAFGNIMTQTGNVNNPFTYAGYQYDNESGLYYLNARNYDPVTARFITEDSYLGDKYDPLSLNLYTYCHNEPIMYIDPSGHTEAQLRDLVAAAGGEVGWNNETRTATATINGVEKKFKIEDFKVEDGRIIIDSNKFDSMFSNNKVSISSRVESKKITATTVTNSSGSNYGGKTETISSSINNYQKSSSLIKPVSNGMSKTGIGTLDKTGKVLYSSAEVVLGGIAAGGAVIYTTSTGGVGGVAGGAYVGTHGLNSVANGVRDFGHIINGDWEEVGTENYLKDNVYVPALAWAGKKIDKTLGGDGTQGENYGKITGSGIYYVVDVMTGAKGTVKAVQTLKKAQWTRGTFQATNTAVQMEKIIGYRTNNELKVNILKDAVGYYYNAKSAIKEFANKLFHYGDINC